MAIYDLNPKSGGRGWNLLQQFPHAFRSSEQIAELVAAVGEIQDAQRAVDGATDNLQLADATERLMRAERRFGQFLTDARRRKDAWIAEARKQFVASRRDKCCVCGKYKAITHAYHVVPLSEQYDRGFESPDHQHVWLCPNHHAVVHALIAKRQDDAVTGRIAASLICEIEEDEEYQAIMRLLGQAGRQP